jgi:hypothetical protein
MSEERYGDQGQRLSYTGEDRSGAGVRSRVAAASAGTTAGKGLGSLGSAGGDMPKQKEGESASEFGERLRVYREKKNAAAQKAALRDVR